MDIEEKISDVLVFAEFRYFLTATSFGNIMVWKFDRTTNNKGDGEGAKRLIHTFEGHNKKVCSIQ